MFSAKHSEVPGLHQPAFAVCCIPERQQTQNFTLANARTFSPGISTSFLL